MRAPPRAPPRLPPASLTTAPNPPSRPARHDLQQTERSAGGPPRAATVCTYPASAPVVASGVPLPSEVAAAGASRVDRLSRLLVGGVIFAVQGWGRSNSGWRARRQSRRIAALGLIDPVRHTRPTWLHRSQARAGIAGGVAVSSQRCRGARPARS